MANILTQSDIAAALVNFFQVALPAIDTSPGSVARDLFVDAPSSQLGLLYTELSNISALQSLRIVAGSDLDRLAQNFGAVRKGPVQAAGTTLFTFSSIPAVVSINVGNLVTASTGATFSVSNGVSVDPAQLNTYRATAIKYQNNLTFLNITDQYAVEVSVQATTAGSAGNISAYAINATTIPGVSHVTNVFPFTGGTDQETDASFRNRVLAIFSGSNVGTALGYKNTALATGSVDDALVVGPGNPLMTRDGTIVVKNPDGSFTIISEGSGGKVDVIILGTVPSSYTDSFVYIDQSNINDPTNTKNLFILGQIPGESSLTIPQRRIQDIANKTLPAQPVQNITQVSGSLSGSNFIPKTVDGYGRVSGNYELIPDTGAYAGSPWSQDKFHWTSNQITMYQENKVKGLFNGQDTTTFTDVLQIPQIQQSIQITNENSTVSSTDRSIITLSHTPATNVTRVLNTNTGERYVIINQNINSTTNTNTSGEIQISGNTLPAVSDILQVDYTWIVNFDPFSDYDGKILANNPRTNGDSIDWGISNAVRSENVLFTLNATNTSFTGTTTHPISYVVNAYQFNSTVGVVSVSTLSNFTNRLAVVLSALPAQITSINSITLANSNQEVYSTVSQDSSIFNTPIVVGIQVLYNVIIILPSDTSAAVGNYVSIEYNTSDVFNVINSTGSFTGNQITIPAGNITANTSQIYLDTTYITSVQNVLVAGITNFQLSRGGNGFISNTNTGSINPILSDTIRRENQTIQQNNSNQLYINLSITSSNFNFDGYQVISVVDLLSGNEIWNTDFPGTVSISNTENYQLIFSGFNSPAVGDNVLVLYFADDINNTQPFTFQNSIFCKNIQTVQDNFQQNYFYVPIDSFVAENNMSFQIIDTTTGLTITSGTDGYLYTLLNNGLEANFSSFSVNFSNIVDLTGKHIVLQRTHNRNNSGTYNIFSTNAQSNSIQFGIIASNLLDNQISIIRIKDGAELWNSSTGTINIQSNLLTMPPTTLANAGDEVMVLLFTNKVLHQSPTKLSITVADQNTNTGKVSVSGTTLTRVAATVFTATSVGLTQNLVSAIISSLGQNSNFQIPSNIAIARIVQVEKVSLTNGNIVLSTLATYDVNGTQIANNILYPNEMIINDSLSSTQFTLPQTTNNIANAPNVGDTLLITFDYMTFNDTDSVYFTRNGTQYSNKKFAIVDRTYISSGFSTTQSAKFTFSSFTQPATGSNYNAFYNYLAPKPNERININYNYNQLIASATFAIENTRPITADVLVKAAQELLVDATINIVISSTYTNSASIVIQNVQNAINVKINTNTLGAVLNSSDLIVAAQSVSGVERSRILAFNLDGSTGQVLSLQAQQNQYFSANVITVNQESL